MMINYVLDNRALPIRGIAQTAGIIDDVAQRGVFLELKDARDVHTSRQSHELSDRRDVDHITGKQRAVLRFISPGQQVVKIESSNEPAAPLQLHLAHGTAFSGTS